MKSAFQENVYAIVKNEKGYSLFRKVQDGERAGLAKWWEDECGEYWKYLFSARDRRSLETCVENYRYVEMSLQKIQNIILKEMEYDRNKS